jgi:hypothetical protein
MIRKSGHRFSEKIMLKQKDRADDDSKKSHRALADALGHRSLHSYRASVSAEGAGGADLIAAH